VATSVVTNENLLERGDYMQIVILMLTAVSFFSLGFNTRILVSYGIRKAKKADEEIELARRVIDKYSAF